MEQFKRDLLISYLKTGFNTYQAFWDIVPSYPIKVQADLVIVHTGMIENGEYAAFRERVAKLINESSK